ncbi:MAG: 3-hydroxyacyl-CoA dehydrogenase NAD-binding domain-containing protein [Bdellovibrionales bacterium]
MSNAFIQKVAVIGSGVMGSQIAAHIANAGIPVLLLDIVPKGGADRSALAKQAIERLRKTKPSPFMASSRAKLITPGNLEDDLDELKNADWIVEAVLENQQIKQDLYRKLESVRKPGSVVSSNTSTLPIKVLTEGLPESFAKDFLVTHFFNPPRYMRLMEMVIGPATRKDAIEILRDFCDRSLGKGVVMAKDTPGFIANRLGVFFIQVAVNAAFDLGLTVEEADAVFGKPAGMPKTGIFGLLDLIGLDLMPHIAQSFMMTLPSDDAWKIYFREHLLIKEMIAEGYTGRKGKGGFYRMNVTPNGKVKETLDLKTGDYRKSEKAKLPEIEAAGKNLRALCETPGRIGLYAWTVLSQTLSYAASLVPQIADDIVAVDSAMRLGFNWRYGPFELLDKLGVEWFSVRLKSERKPIPSLLLKISNRPFYRVDNGKLQFLTVDGEYQPVRRSSGVLMLSDIKLTSKPVEKSGSASLWDIGDGVLCLEFHTKMNAIDPNVLDMIKKAIEIVTTSQADKSNRWKALVVYNEAENFSVGANLGLALFAINIEMFPAIENMVKQGHETYQALRFAPFPTVAAPYGMTLGGACELTLHSSATQAHAETYIGLVEAGVGLIPSWGGCAQMLGRAITAKKRFGGPIPPVSQVFETLSMAKVSTSAQEGQDMGFLRASDGITMNRDRLLFDAKQRALDLAKDYKPPEPWSFNLPGATGRAALNLAIEGFRLLGKAQPHDVTVAKALANVVCGSGELKIAEMTAESQMLEFERREFMKLIQTPETIARISHMLNTGKPLRN